MAGRLYLVPNALGPGAIETVLPAHVATIAARLDYFVGENARSTRAFLKRIGDVVPLARSIRDIEIVELDVSTPADVLPALLAPLLAGRDGGLISEAGCPAVADPGAGLVRLAHQHAIDVMPLVGPSAILLALMASGLDGQRFAFNGYLPTDPERRAQAIRDSERRSSQLKQTQVFIETPYRNGALLEALCAACRPATLLCVASDLTLETQTIATRRIDRWNAASSEFDRRPSIFLVLGQ